MGVYNSQMALRGSVEDFPVTDIIELAHRHRKTGTLTITGGYSQAYVEFRDGLIVWADATQQKLGVLMQRAGLLTEEQQAEVLAEQDGSDLRFGDLLVRKELITREDLEDFVQLQVREAVFRVMLLPRGDYEFKTQDVGGEAALATPLDPQHMLMDAVRMIDEWPKLQKSVRGIGGVPQRVDGTEELVHRSETDSNHDDDISQNEPGVLQLTGAQTRVWDLVDGKTSVQQIVDRSRLGTYLAFKCLAALLHHGLIEAAAEEMVAEG